MSRVRAIARCRVDLAGGTLDIWPLGLLHPGAVTVNVAVDLPVRVEVERRERGWSVAQGGEFFETDRREELESREGTALVARPSRTRRRGVASRERCDPPPGPREASMGGTELLGWCPGRHGPDARARTVADGSPPVIPEAKICRRVSPHLGATDRES